nr:RICIN domain-containing protein [Nocardia asiatica]
MPSRKVVDIKDRSRHPGAPVIQWDYWGGGNQRLRLDPINPLGSAVYRIMIEHSGMCLEPGVQTGVVVPVAPLHEREPDLCECLERAVPVDDLGFEQADDRFGEGVDAPVVALDRIEVVRRILVEWDSSAMVRSLDGRLHNWHTTVNSSAGQPEPFSTAADSYRRGRSGCS